MSSTDDEDTQIDDWFPDHLHTLHLAPNGRVPVLLLSGKYNLQTTGPQLANSACSYVELNSAGHNYLGSIQVHLEA